MSPLETRLLRVLFSWVRWDMGLVIRFRIGCRSGGAVSEIVQPWELRARPAAQWIASIRDRTRKFWQKLRISKLFSSRFKVQGVLLEGNFLRSLFFSLGVDFRENQWDHRTIVFLANFYVRIMNQIANSSHMQHLHWRRDGWLKKRKWK